MQKLEAETKAYLKAGDRATAAKFALELQKAKTELAANEQQLQMHETAYGNNLRKIQHANSKLIELQQKIQKYDAELKMSAAEAEIAKLAESFDLNLTTDFGQIESGHPAEDRSEPRQGARRRRSLREGHRRDRGRGADAGVLAEEALTNFEVELGSEVAGDDAHRAGDQGPGTGGDRQGRRRSRRTDR